MNEEKGDLLRSSASVVAIDDEVDDLLCSSQNIPKFGMKYDFIYHDD